MGSRTTMISEFINCPTCFGKLHGYFTKNSHGIDDVCKVNHGTIAFSVKSDWGGGGPLLIQYEMREFIKRENLCCSINFSGAYEPQSVFSLSVDSHDKEVTINELDDFV